MRKRGIATVCQLTDRMPQYEQKWRESRLCDCQGGPFIYKPIYIGLRLLPIVCPLFLTNGHCSNSSLFNWHATVQWFLWQVHRIMSRSRTLWYDGKSISNKLASNCFGFKNLPHVSCLRLGSTHCPIHICITLNTKKYPLANGGRGHASWQIMTAGITHLIYDSLHSAMTPFSTTCLDYG